MSESATQQLQQRVARWNASGIAHQLWPDVPPHELEIAHDVIWRAVADMLAGRQPSALAQPDGASPRALAIAATFSGLGPLIGYWIEQLKVAADPPLDDLFREHLQHGRRRAAVLAEHLHRTLTELQHVGADPILLKGAHTSREYFPDPGTRPAADLDVLVHPDHLARARRALSAIGLVPSLQPQSPHAETWHRVHDPTVHALDVDHADNPWQVDLHTSIDRSFFRGCATAFGQRPFELTRSVTIDGLPARVLRQPMLLAHLAQHTSRDFYRMRLLRIVELIFVIRRDVQRGLDFGALPAFLERVEATRFLWPAFAFVERLAPGTVDRGFSEAISRAAPPRLRAGVERALAAPLRGYFRRSPEERFMWSRGSVEWLRCVSDIVWPPGRTIGERVWTLRRRARMARGRVATWSSTRA